MKYGIYNRTKPRLFVLRGFTGNESSGLTHSAQITTSVTIKSGQVITLTSGKWVLGGILGQVPYIAYQDSTDTDVVSSGLLLGLSCSGDFELQSAYFKSADTFTRDIPVTFDSTTGDIKATTYTAAAEQDILGFCTAGKVDLNTGGPGSGAANTANTGIDSQAAPDGSGHVYVIQWVTRWLPRREVSASQS